MKPIIDVACGGRMFWFDKHNPNAVFCDKRTLERMELCDGRMFEVAPDIVCDFQDLPFADEIFYLAVFDPPHLKQINETAYMAIKYGKLYAGWEEVLHHGFCECMRVLKPHGVLIFKWNEIQIPVKDVIKALGENPLFGHISGRKSKTHWLCFMKGV